MAKDKSSGVGAFDGRSSGMRAGRGQELFTPILHHGAEVRIAWTGDSHASLLGSLVTACR